MPRSAKILFLQKYNFFLVPKPRLGNEEKSFYAKECKPNLIKWVIFALRTIGFRSEQSAHLSVFFPNP